MEKNQKTPSNDQADKTQVDIINGEIVGSILKKRFCIQSLLDQGSFGKVYRLIDLKNKKLPLVVKISPDYKNFGKEIHAMRKIYKKSRESQMRDTWSTPNVIDYGMIIKCEAGNSEEQELMSYCIMPRYGTNLETYFEKMKCKLSKASVLDLGLAILSMLESIHLAGFTFNDLKLDNMLVGYQNKLPATVAGESAFTDASIHLVDFGFATRYLD